VYHLIFHACCDVSKQILGLSNQGVNLFKDDAGEKQVRRSEKFLRSFRKHVRSFSQPENVQKETRQTSGFRIVVDNQSIAAVIPGS